MTPLLAVGGMAAATVLSELFSRRKVNSVQGYTPQNGSTNSGSTDFEKTLRSMTDQAAKAGANASSLSVPLPDSAAKAATDFLKARETDLSQELKTGVQSGAITDAQRQAVEKLSAQAAGGIDMALSDGVLTMGEFKQASASLEDVAKQLDAYRKMQNAASRNQSAALTSVTV